MWIQCWNWYLIPWLFLRQLWIFLLVILLTFLWPLRKNLFTLQHLLFLWVKCFHVKKDACFKLSTILPLGCGSSGFQSKTPPDNCWGSTWPSLCKQTARGSSLRLAHGWSDLYPGESKPMKNDKTCYKSPEGQHGWQSFSSFKRNTFHSWIDRFGTSTCRWMHHPEHNMMNVL